MEKRRYGKEGIELSIIGLGGVLVMHRPPSETERIVGEAIDAGINYFDVAPQYGDAQQNLGPALAPYRDGVFLACKTLQRDGAGARAELEDSLRKLKTDCFDLYQLHAMTTLEDFEEATGPGGALEVLVAAKEEGLIRHIGFSAHSASIACRLLDCFAFDSTLFPINFVTMFEAGFGPQVVEKASATGASVLALKAMALRLYGEGEKKRYARCWYLPIEDEALAALALRYTLSQPVTAAVPPGEERFFKWAVKVAQNFTPIASEEIEVLRQQAVGQTPLFSVGGAS